MAVGMIEVQGFGTALAIADTMCKTAEITIDAFDANNPSDPGVKIPVIVQVKFRGGVSEVYAALEAGRREAQNYLSDNEIVTDCIPMETDEILPLIKEGKLKPSVKPEEKTAEEQAETGTEAPKPDSEPAKKKTGRQTGR